MLTRTGRCKLAWNQKIERKTKLFVFCSSLSNFDLFHFKGYGPKLAEQTSVKGFELPGLGLQSYRSSMNIRKARGQASQSLIPNPVSPVKACSPISTLLPKFPDCLKLLKISNGCFSSNIIFLFSVLLELNIQLNTTTMTIRVFSTSSQSK